MAKKYGLFRYLVAKHFLSKSLDELEKNERRNKFDIPLLVRLLLFQHILDEIFPNDSRKYNLGLKMSKKNKALF